MLKIIITTIVTLIIDSIWLFSMKMNYDKWLINFERNINWVAIVLVYIAIPLGLFYFVISRYIGQSLSLKIVGEGFLFGILTYAVYDLTNLATLKNWSIQMTIVDILWGGILCALTTLIVILIFSRF